MTDDDICFLKCPRCDAMMGLRTGLAFDEVYGFCGPVVLACPACALVVSMATVLEVVRCSYAPLAPTKPKKKAKR